PSAATGHRRAPSAITGRRRPPPGADFCKAVVKRPDSHHFAELDRTDGRHPASPATPTAAPPQAPPRRRPPHQPPPPPPARLPSRRRPPPRKPCPADGRLTSPLLAPRLDSPRRPPSPQRSCRRIVPARTPAGRRLRGPRTRGGPRQTDPP